jgi:nitroreductase
METFECFEKRRTIRNYNDHPVEWEKVGNVLRAGQLAPSSGNVQDWRFVVVTDKSKRAAIANAALKQAWIAKAPVIIVIYAEPVETKRFYGLRGEKLYSIQNCAAAIENMLLAATDQGLASAWVGAFDETMLNSVLGAPDSARPQAMIVMGYSDSNPDPVKRYNLVDLTFINSWGSKIVNVDLAMDDFSEVVRKKLVQAKTVIKEEGPAAGKGLLEKGKAHLKRIQEKLKEQSEEKKIEKNKKLSKELGDEEEILDDTEEELDDSDSRL